MALQEAARFRADNQPGFRAQIPEYVGFRKMIYYEQPMTFDEKGELLVQVHGLPRPLVQAGIRAEGNSINTSYLTGILRRDLQLSASLPQGIDEDPVLLGEVNKIQLLTQHRQEYFELILKPEHPAYTLSQIISLRRAARAAARVIGMNTLDIPGPLRSWYRQNSSRFTRRLA